MTTSVEDTAVHVDEHAALRADRVARTSTEPTPRIRSSVDVVRAFAGLSLVVIGLLLTNVFDSTMLGLSEDTSTNMDRLPAWARSVAGSAMASIALVGTVAVAVWSLVTTRYRRFALYTLGAVAAAAASVALGRLAYAIVEPPVQVSFELDVPFSRMTGSDGRLNPADPLLAAATATLTIAASFMTARVVRRVAIVVVAYALASALTVGAPPLNLLIDVGAGLLVGSLLLLLVGRHDTALRSPQIQEALAAAGYEVDRLDRATSDDAVWDATLAGGDTIVVRAWSRDDRSSALLARVARWLRVRSTADHRPLLSLRRVVEHEALVRLQARNRGIATPTVRAVTVAGIDGMILAHDPIDGAASSVPSRDRTIDPESLRRIWGVAGDLQDVRIAHGRLRLDVFVFDAAGLPWITEFSRGELAAADQRLGIDLAELLASSAGEVGIGPAVRIAVDEVGPETLGRSLPWLQPLALSPPTRSAIDGDRVEELRAAVADVCGVEPDEPVKLERVDSTTLFVLATIVLSAWFLVPQLTDLDSLWSQARNASPSWALAAVAFSCATYVAATASLLGALPVRLAFGPALAAQVASSFANRVTPAKVGGMATNIRFFQRKGIPTAVGASAVGLNAVTGVVVHLVLTVSALLLASSDRRAGELQLPGVGTVVLVLAALGLTAVFVVLVPATRRRIATHVVPQLRTAREAIEVVLHDPVRLVVLVGGALSITLCYLGAMFASLRAFDSTASLPLVALLFLTGSVVANAAPTPGGLGAAEAALIASLSTVESASIVVPAVFLYRLVTFWLPILPGWIALTMLRRRDAL